MHGDYAGQGVDQLQKVIDTIKANPNDRRMIMCAWNAKVNKHEFVQVATVRRPRFRTFP